MNGLQVAALVAAAGESMKGWQTAGLICVAGERGEGVQIAGLGSVSGEKFKGLQVAGLFSVAGEGIEGIQAAGLFAVAGENLKGVQISGLFNVAGEESQALQVAGLANITGETCRGLQVGLFNLAGRLTGLQLGLVNVAGNIEGLPVGLVNLTRKKDRRMRLTAWAGNASLLNAGVKIRAKMSYSILYVGTVNLTQEPRECLAFGFQYGYGVPVRSAEGDSGRAMRVDVDAGYLYLDNSTLFRHFKGTPDRHVLSLRAAWAVEVSPDVSIFAGTGLRYTVDYGAGFGNGAVSPLLFAGLELF
jgi:hypothetical protein